MNGLKEKIEHALYQFASGNLADNAKHLLNVLGYESKRTMRLTPNTAERFLEVFNQDPERRMNPDKALIEKWESIDFIFQLTKDEVPYIRESSENLGDAKYDESIYKSYLFFALKLRGDQYSRTKLSDITREINKLDNKPAMILFQHGEALTFAVIDRRLNEQVPDKDVLLKATLIKDINFADPHRAHIDILSDLSIAELHEKHKFKNFAELHEAWRKTLDTELLNRQFYQRLFDWFQWAISEAKFPDDEKRTVKSEEHVIRLITRLLFVWFIKEKGLVADELFNETQVARLLKDYDRDSGDSYYRAVLQNLFFATLNTEIENRRFSKETNADHRNFDVYRYKAQINEPDELRTLFDKTPFINGGLFDCLDDFEAIKDGGSRIDCFSDRHYKRLSIPNRLFFDKHRGLFSLLTHYKFTVEENTPIEQEVALDPELLGKVFENLLAAYNPETGTTARKQTGSYYTPRIIVDYMVEEALVAALAERAQPSDGDAKFWNERLHYLLDYAKVFDDASVWFDSRESDEVVRGISELTVLDPAVGSGAFPMGVLHKLTLALRRLDPDNARWETLQKERAGARASAAFDTSDQQARDVELAEISDTFELYRDSDFGRKLYLIQNSIFGVDIQPVACQIAKLRFFISLAIEQEPDRDANNFGIKPLPNLETRFVAANTLIGLKADIQLFLENDTIQKVQSEIQSIRERYFLASTRKEKLGYIDKENECRRELQHALNKQQAAWVSEQKKRIDQMVAKLPTEESRKQLREELEKEYEWLEQEQNVRFEEARKIARWVPYDQNTFAEFFDPVAMFSVRNGFDITIGNPPYVRADAPRQQALRREIEDSNQYETLWEKWDLYIPFIERSYKLLKPGGFTTLIVSDAYCHSKYAQKSQNWFLKNSRILRLDFLSKIKVFDAGVHNVTYLFQKADGSHQKPERRVHELEFGAVNLLPTNEQRQLTYRVFFPEDTDFQSLSVPTVSLDEICYITKGMVVHAHERKARGEFELRDLVSDVRDEHHPKPFVEGKHLARWLPTTNKWLEWGTKRAPDLFSRPTFPELYKVEEKLISIDMAAGVEKLRVAYDNRKLYHNHSAWSFIPWHSLSGVSNRSIKKQARYRDETTRRSNLPEREELEKTSRCFAVKFLLGVMNSTASHNFLRANRRSNIHLYPDDWKKLPIPDVSPEQQAPVVELVDRILAKKQADADTDVSALENEIDEIVYSLYGLTTEEIAIVETATDC